ncbi:hypothetical protein RYX36_020234 [Vicia faba]
MRKRYPSSSRTNGGAFPSTFFLRSPSPDISSSDFILSTARRLSFSHLLLKNGSLNLLQLRQSLSSKRHKTRLVSIINPCLRSIAQQFQPSKLQYVPQPRLNLSSPTNLPRLL